jgi:hypothetical protein
MPAVAGAADERSEYTPIRPFPIARLRIRPQVASHPLAGNQPRWRAPESVFLLRVAALLTFAGGGFLLRL